MVSQLAEMAVASPAAPIAIKPRPSGTFAPEKVSTAPRPRSAPLTMVSMKPRFSFASPEKSGAISFDLEAELPALSPPILLISSKLAILFPAFFAEAPKPSNAFFSALRFSAASADSSSVVPKIAAVTVARAPTTWAST